MEHGAEIDALYEKLPELHPDYLKGESLQGKPKVAEEVLEADLEMFPATPVEIDCEYPMSPEAYARMKAEEKVKREANKGAKEAHKEPSDEEIDRMMRFSDESRMKRKRHPNAQKKGARMPRTKPNWPVISPLAQNTGCESH